MTEVRPVATRNDSVRRELRELFDSFENVPELVKVLKVGEEFGEAAEAIIGLYAFNPRKGQNGDRRSSQTWPLRRWSRCTTSRPSLSRPSRTGYAKSTREP